MITFDFESLRKLENLPISDFITFNLDEREFVIFDKGAFLALINKCGMKETTAIHRG